jgi:uncharacterized protein (TIGR02246 family)
MGRRCVLAGAMAALLATAAIRAAEREICSEDALARLPRELIAADNRRNLSAVLRLYAEDAVWFPPSGEPVSRRPDIADRYRELFRSQPALEIEVHGTAFGGEHGVAWGRTHGSVRATGGEVRIVDDAFALAARCEAGVWKVTLLAWHPAG